MGLIYVFRRVFLTVFVTVPTRGVRVGFLSVFATVTAGDRVGLIYVLRVCLGAFETVATGDSIGLIYVF